VIAPDRSIVVLAALAKLGRWSREHSRASLVLPAASPPLEHVQAVTRAFRLARYGVLDAGDIVAGAACYGRALHESAFGGDWVSHVLGTDLAEAQGFE